MIKRVKIDITDQPIVKLPADALVIDFAPSRGTNSAAEEYIDMWYDDPGESNGEIVAYRLWVKGTGMNAPSGGIWLKTLVMGSGMVWHLYITQ